MSIFLSAIGVGFVAAAVLLISTVGFTVQYGVSNVFNLAYGPVMGVAVLAAYAVNTTNVPIGVSILVGGAVGAVMSAMLERFVIRRMQSRKMNSWVVMIVTLSVGLILDSGVLAIWGPGFRSFQGYESAIRWGPMIFTSLEIWCIITALCLALIMQVLLHTTQVGRAIRATAGNAPLARMCGISTERIATLGWLLSGALCGIGGVFYIADTASFTYSSTTDFMPLVIAAAIVGGIGEPLGAIAGAVLVGLVSSVAGYYLNSAFVEVFALLLLVIVMFVRPSGIRTSIRQT